MRHPPPETVWPTRLTLTSDSEMNRTWDAYYYNGKTAARYDVKVSITNTGLRITGDGLPTIAAHVEWPFNEINFSQDSYAGEPVRLERRGASLVIIVHGFIEELRRVSPSSLTKFSNVRNRRKSVIIAVIAVVCIAVALAGFYVSLPIVAGYAAARVPASVEDSLGSAVAEQMAQSIPGGKCEDAELKKQLEAVLSSLDHAARPHPYTFRIHIVNNKIVNAFAAPGGHIVIFTGLLEKTERTEELAGVLAHEMQHVLKRHATKALFQQLSAYMLLSVVTGGNVSGVARIADSVIQTTYSRASEREADEAGQALLIKALIDPSGLSDFLKKLDKEGAAVPGILRYVASHPLTGERLRYLEAGAKDKGAAFPSLLPDTDCNKLATACSKGL